MFVIFPCPSREREGELDYMIQTPSWSEDNPFDNRHLLPEEWAGLRDDDLRAVCGVPDAVFVHGFRFCGGAESEKGAVEMALRLFTPTP